MRGCNLYEAFQNPYKKHIQSELLSINNNKVNNNSNTKMNYIEPINIKCDNMINHILSCKDCRQKMIYYLKEETMTNETFTENPKINLSGQSKNKQTEFMINIILGIILILLFA